MVSFVLLREILQLSAEITEVFGFAARLKQFFWAVLVELFLRSCNLDEKAKTHYEQAGTEEE